ncbi:PadR family transcriptional regulator [Dactylosporangium sp. NPDC051485]|uniref:PadR family transcriptional regulator n=1 Tax=Dactylosporangium sp. NPDC051485 TaxID=3154846 RepID=UPI003423CF6D
MPIQHAVLALLTDGPSYGYQLRTSFERAVGPQWGGFNIGHVYQILDRLSRDGLVSGRTVQQETGRPDRTIYRITAAGRRELDSWLAEPVVRTAGFRDDFLLKVLAAARRGPDAVLEVCQTQRNARMAELQTLRALRRQHREEPLAGLTIDAAILHTQADLKLIDAAEERAHHPQLAVQVEDSAAPPATGRARAAM